ncbi:MAG: cytochrome b/b6 domain-containing protein, partial [Pseudomonadota bacterium]|nr:cytochrome b/b6 domain-containing protein [Pseudomonadota bacterium]
MQNQVAAPVVAPVAALGAALRRVRVWDLPTRLFHWALALLVTGSLVSGKIGGDAMPWHFRFGYGIFALLLFRLVWGLVGGRWSRFANFLYAPGTVWRYVRGHSRAGEALEVGHNPLGSLSVFALLAVLLVQVATGLVTDDEISLVGPLNRLVPTDVGLSATSWHNTGGQWLVFGLVGLHLAAIAWYRLGKRVELTRPMISGDKPLPADTPASS